VKHANELTRYKETATHGPNFLKPPPDLIQGEEEWEVEAIIKHKRTRWGIRYRVKWKGYPSSENSWEPESNLEHAADILAAYKKAHGLQ
jgi:hypothetical protein